MKALLTVLAAGLLIALAHPASAQSSREAAALSLRINNIEDQLRRMTGELEEMSHKFKILEEQLRRFSEDTEYRFQNLKGGGKSRVRRKRRPSVAIRTPPPPPIREMPLDKARQDTVRNLGVIPGRSLDFSVQPQGFNAPPLPSSRPQDEDATAKYDYSYGLILRRDYEGARKAFKEFLSQHAQHTLAGNAQYWLGESYFARGQYRQAADEFLTGYTKYSSSRKAPGSLLKLGLSLIQLKQKNAACAAFSELGKKFPKASSRIKKRAIKERRRAGC